MLRRAGRRDLQGQPLRAACAVIAPMTTPLWLFVAGFVATLLAGFVLGRRVRRAAERLVASGSATLGEEGAPPAPPAEVETTIAGLPEPSADWGPKP